MASMVTGIAALSLRLDAPPSDLLTVLALPDAGRAMRIYWSAPEGDETIVGFGETRRVTAWGPDRLGQVARACALAMQPVIERGGEPEVAHVRWFGGFAFSDVASSGPLWEGFPAVQFTLPEALVVRRAGEAWLTVTAPVDRAPALDARARKLVGAWTDGPAVYPAVGDRRFVGGPRDDPTSEGRDAVARTVRRRIGRAIQAIDRGDVEKVVVSTARTVCLPQPIDPVSVLDRLRQIQPGCFHFLVSPRPGLAFLGATPERLVRLTDSRLSTTALAGSAPRDPDPATDRALGEALLASEKDRVEHRLVVDAIRDALAGYSPSVPDTPRLLRLATIQHLETPIEARLSGPGDVLEAAARLHPTPALGGTPLEAALELIRELEDHDRGWYGGAVGWIDGRGDGDLAVAIRSLLLRGETVTAFAGAGIVAGSDPDSEVREIELKLRAVLAGCPTSDY